MTQPDEQSEQFWIKRDTGTTATASEVDRLLALREGTQSPQQGSSSGEVDRLIALAKRNRRG